MWETWVRSLGWEDPLEKRMATHLTILAWRIPWNVYSPWGCKESDTAEQHTHTHIYIHMHTYVCVCVCVLLNKYWQSFLVIDF